MQAKKLLFAFVLLLLFAFVVVVVFVVVVCIRCCTSSSSLLPFQQNEMKSKFRILSLSNFMVQRFFAINLQLLPPNIIK